jgi:hypothetical protein
VVRLLCACVAALVLAQGCLGGDTQIVHKGGHEDDAGAAGGADGSAPAGGADGGPSLPDDRCDLDQDLDTLDGWEVGGNRWSLNGGRLTVAASDGRGSENGLALRGRDEACTDLDASVTFVPGPRAYPILVARASASGPWYGVGYDGRYGAVVLLTGYGVETGETVAPLEFLDLEPNRPYRLALRVVDDHLLGALYDGDGERPLAVLHGPAPDRPGPGRIGLLEAAGGSVRFERLRAKPVARADSGPPRFESARLVAPDTLLVTTEPRAMTPLAVASVPGGLHLRVGGGDAPLTGVAPNPGTTTELALTADAFLRGTDDVALSQDGGGGVARDGEPLAAFDAPVDNLLWVDGAFAPFEDPFDGDKLGAGWAADPPEAFALGRGALTVSPQGRYGDKAWLKRSIAEAHVDASLTADFQFDPQPRRETERTQVIAALRARSAGNAHYEAVYGYGDFDAALTIRVQGRDGYPADLAAAPVPRDAAPPNTPLRLVFSASGPLLWASLYRLGDGAPTLVASIAVDDRQVTGPGPIAITAHGNGTVRFDRVRVEPASAPPPRVASAEVLATDPLHVQVSVLAASALRGLDPAGFTVWAGDRRSVSEVGRTPEGLSLRVSGPPIQAGQRVFLSYDAGAGHITDSGAQRLTGVDRLEVRNEAPPAPVLALAHARLVTPDTLDLVVTDSGALPVKAGAAEGLTVRVRGHAAAVVAARALPEERDLVRVSFDAEAAPGDPVEVRYEAGKSGPIVDEGGQELRAFADAFVEDLLAVPSQPATEHDDFERMPGPTVGNDWEARTPALWALEDGALRYDGDQGLDARLLRPAMVSPTRYRVAVKARAGAFRVGEVEPVAAIFGSYARTNPANPDEFFDVRLSLDFATHDVSLIGQFNAPVAGTRIEGALPDTVRLVVEVNGRAAEGRVETTDGRVLATLRYFLPFAAPAGRVGLAGGASGTVYFDDWTVDAPDARPPLTQVLGARVAAATPNDVQVEVGTPSGRVVTGGGPEGWAVRVDGAARRVEGVQVSGRSLLVHFGGPAVAARSRVTVAYDARHGDVHDGSAPVPFPLEALPATPAVNQAAVGGDLFVVGAEVVDPWSVDLVFNDQAALPATAEADAAGSFAVTAADRAVPVRAIAALPMRDARLRLLLAAPIAAGADVHVAWHPGEAGARVLDRNGAELQAPYEADAANGLSPAPDFAPYTDDFEGPGINFGAGWTADPPESWARDHGDALFRRDDFREGPSLLRPAGELYDDVDLTTEVRVDAPALSFVAAGLVARVGADGGYRGWYAGADGLNPVLRVERMGPFGGTVLAQVPVPRFDPNATYSFRFTVQGSFVRLEVRNGQALVGLVGAVGPGAPLPPGRIGLVAQGSGTARFSDFTARPPAGSRARVVALRATVFNYAPDTVAVDVAAATRLLFADGHGFRASVNGQPRNVAGVTVEASRLLLRLDGPPLAPADDVRVGFDPASGLVVDDEPVPQPLGAFADLAARASTPPLLASTTVVGRNLVELTYATGPNGLPLHLEGQGGLQLWVDHPDLGPAPIRLGLVEVWLDPAREGDTLLLASADAIPRGAMVSIVAAPRPGDRLADAAGVEPAPLDLPVTAPAARTVADLDPPAAYDAAWGGADPSGWRSYGPQANRWTEEDGALVASGSGVPGAATQAFAPAFTAVGDVKVTADFRIDDTADPLGRNAWPQVNVRGLDDRFWIGCFVRNDRGLLPQRDANGHFDMVDDASPALVCAVRSGEAEVTRFDACRMQFYEVSPDGGRVRYDWAAHWLDRHRLVVKIRGRRLRAELYDLDDRDHGIPRFVAATEVPDVGDQPALGMVGLGAGDSGRVRYTAFRAEPLAADDFAPLDPRFAPTGDCR